MHLIFVFIWFDLLKEKRTKLVILDLKLSYINIHLHVWTGLWQLNVTMYRAYIVKYFTGILNQVALFVCLQVLVNEDTVFWTLGSCFYD